MGDMAAAYYDPPHAAHHYPHPYYAPPPPSYYAPPPPPGATPPPLPEQRLPPPSHHPYSNHYPHHPPPLLPPSYGSPYGLPPPIPSRDEVRTLFVAGLPEDVKPREIYNLFREFPGYESSHLRNSGKSSQAYAFAVFSDQPSAMAAMHAVNGMIFDLENEVPLYVDLAKSNSRGKRSRREDGLDYSSDKRSRKSGSFPRGFADSGAGSNIHMSGMGNSAYSLNGYPSTQSNASLESLNDEDSINMNSTFVPQNNPPCPTLFVANLGPSCSERELTHVFSSCPGFIKLKLQNKFGVPVAFADFQDVNSSTAALNQLQGTMLYSLDGEGMRLEYAKSRMGLRKREKRR